MPLITIQEARKVAQRYRDSLRQNQSTRSSALLAKIAHTITVTSSSILLEESRRYSSKIKYDIFLSHKTDDADAVLGVKTILKELHYEVYVDWVEDNFLDRSEVTPETAERLRIRMQNCNALFFAHSGNSQESLWMPWELGYFDGLKGKVAILPLRNSRISNAFVGQEYLGLYPYAIEL